MRFKLKKSYVSNPEFVYRYSPKLLCSLRLLWQVFRRCWSTTRMGSPASPSTLWVTSHHT